LLLNSDTLVPSGAIETLRAAAYAAASTGTVTPFSNEASICSHPSPSGGNAMPDLAGTERLNALARRANGAKTVEIPTAVGSCMYIRHDCLRAVGGFRAQIFAQGYGEENDFSLRARHLGFFHRAAPGAYVAHEGGVSFRAAARGLTARNLEILNNLYPGYHALVMDFIAADRLAPARARLDAAVLAAEPARDAVLLISHSHGGGVARQVAAHGAEMRAGGQRVLELVTAFPADPVKTPYPWPALLTEPGVLPASNLRFTLPAAMPALLRQLRALRVRRVVLHHTLGHHPAVREIALHLGVPQDIVIHDYSSFCPRINLLTRPPGEATPRYCGEPALSGCIACCRRARAGIYEPIPVKNLIARSAAEFAAAASVTAPSEDAARRIARHFPGLRPSVKNWEDDSLPVTLRPPPRGPRRIAVIGGIGPSKGFDVLLACARDAADRRLPLSFAIAGRSADDDKLLATGRIFITGYYAESQAQNVIAELAADLAFLPSIWPETWCFALSEAWRAGLYALAFDLGAQAARITTTGRGGLLPLGLPAARINDLLLGWQPTKKISS
jgi:glycosyltransferase involved in cell wall biosynthesis